MPRPLRALPFLAVSVLAVACSSAPAPAPSAEDVGATADALTGSDAVSRADEWVAVKLQYCQAPNGGRDYDSACSTYCHRYGNAQWDPYRSDCSGLVSWAWGLPAPGRVTGEFAPFQTDITHAIPATDLRAGDAVNNSDHVMLFKAWTIAGKQATFIEEPGCSSSTPYAHEFTSDVTINGSSISVAWNGMTFTAIRYDALAPPVPPNAPPKGALDAATCATGGLSGWAQDPDAATAPIFVDLYFDAPAGKTGSGKVRTKASVSRSDLCKPLGSCDHGFAVDLPLGLRDGTPHEVYAYGIDDSGKGPDPLLASAPRSLTCPAPAMPLSAQAGVKRWVATPQALAAWKLDPLLDVAREPKATVDAYAKGPDMPAAPTAVVADDGSPEVWVVDGNVRRHAVDSTSLSAWQLAVVKWPAAKVEALAQGADWPKAPFAFMAEGQPEVYVLDAALPSAPPQRGTGGSGNGAPPGAGAAPGSGSGATATPSADAEATTGSNGCSIGTTGTRGAPAWAALLAGLVIALAPARRRRSGPRCSRRR